MRRPGLGRGRSTLDMGRPGSTGDSPGETHRAMKKDLEKAGVIDDTCGMEVESRR